MPRDDYSTPDWTPPTPPMPDQDTIGTGSTNIDGLHVVLTVDKDKLDSYSNHTPVPGKGDV